MKTILQQLIDLEQLMAEAMTDAMDKAEEEGYTTRGCTFCVAEEADPELDMARTHVQDAIEALQESPTQVERESAVSDIPEELGYVIELAQHRAEMWQEYADDGDIALKEFYESDMRETCVMADTTRDAVDKVNNWYRQVK